MCYYPGVVCEQLSTVFIVNKLLHEPVAKAHSEGSLHLPNVNLRINTGQENEKRYCLFSQRNHREENEKRYCLFSQRNHREENEKRHCLFSQRNHREREAVDGDHRTCLHNHREYQPSVSGAGPSEHQSPPQHSPHRTHCRHTCSQSSGEHYNMTRSIANGEKDHTYIYTHIV